MSLLTRVTVAALAAAFAGGCAQHVYIPTQHATATLPETGMPAALYAVPQAAPRGEVTVAALGMRKLHETHYRELAIRMIVKNNSDQPWQLDVRQQQVLLPSGAQIEPSYVIGASPQSPIVAVPPRGQARIDLVYSLGPVKPRAFQLVWALVTPEEFVTQRTDFRREEVIPEYAYAPPVYGDGYFYAPFFYSYPAYPYAGFGPVAVRGRPAFPRVGRRPTYVVPRGRPIAAERPGRL